MADAARSCLARVGGKSASDVQELFGGEDLGAYGSTSSTRLQWAAFPCDLRLFELNRCAILLAAVGTGGGPSGAAHPSDSCGMNFIKIFADLESQLGIVSKGFSPDGRLLHTPSWVFSAASIPAVSSKSDVLAPQPLGPVGVLAKSITFLDKLKKRTLEEEFEVVPGVAATKTEAQVERISTHPSRIPWSDHSSARGERAEGSDGPSQGIRELGATRTLRSS